MPRSSSFRKLEIFHPVVAVTASCAHISVVPGPNVLLLLLGQLSVLFPAAATATATAALLFLLLFLLLLLLFILFLLLGPQT